MAEYQSPKYDDHSKDEGKRGSVPKDIPGSPCSMLAGSPANMFSSILLAPPLSFTSMEQILKAAEDVSKSGFNMALVHEIAVNKDFKLQQAHHSDSLEKKIAEIFHKAFWDLLTEQLSAQPPEYAQALLLLKEIKKIPLWLLLPHNTRLKNEINEVLDMDLIEQQMWKVTIDVFSYTHFILLTMARQG